MNEDDMQRRIVRLEADLKRLSAQLEDQAATRNKLSSEEQVLRRDEREHFARQLVTTGKHLIYAVLALIAAAMWTNYQLETRRIEAGTTKPVITPSPAPAPAGARPGPAPPQAATTPGKTPSAAEREADAERKLYDQIDRAPGRSGGNSYSLSLDHLGDILKSMVRTGEITADKATDLMEEFGKEVIRTGSDIVKETAKALIARHLGPTSETKATAGMPTQQVQVNVYPAEKRVVVAQPTKTTPPTKPKPVCRPAVADTSSLSCRIEAPAAGS